MISLRVNRRGAEWVLGSIFSVCHHAASMSASEDQVSLIRVAPMEKQRGKKQFPAINIKSVSWQSAVVVAL
jgi:hypothetical protein